MYTKPKFKVGDRVGMAYDNGIQFTVAIVHFDPSDGWEYGDSQNDRAVKILHFEEDLELIREAACTPKSTTKGGE